MLDSLKKSWRQIKSDRPGERFQAHYRRSRGQNNQGGARRAINIVAGIVITIIGLILLPAPGPGTLILIPGLALLASEFEAVARGLDRLEVLGRNLWQKMRGR